MTNTTIDDKVLVVTDLNTELFDGVRECVDIAENAIEAAKKLRERRYGTVLIDQDAVFLAKRSDYSVTGSEIFAALRRGGYGRLNKDTQAYLLVVSDDGSDGKETVKQWFRCNGYLQKDEERKAA